QRHNSDTFIRDPEFYGKRGAADYRFVGGFNVPYTYPDHNNLYLAAVNANGEVLIQSFNRPWISGSVPAGPLQKYAQLRPHPSYHPNFSTPDSDGGGDVRNLDGGLGAPKPGGGYFNNDSVWIDLGHPVMTAPDGRRFKPLFAFLIIDLDNKVNLNATGNIRAYNNAAPPGPPTPTHASNMGFGPWEINLSRVLQQP